MKVQPTDPQPAVQKTTAQPFKQLLAEAKKGPQPAAKPKSAASTAAGVPKAPTARVKPPISTTVGAKAAINATNAVTTAAVTTAAVTRAASQTRQVARQHSDAEADRLALVRSHHHQAASHQEVKAVESTASALQRVDARVLSLIVKELESAFEKEPPPIPRAANSDGKQPFSGEQVRSPAPVEPPARAEQAVALIERIETFVKSSRPALALTLNNSLGARVEIERLGPGQVALKLVGQQGPPSADAISRIREELKARGLKVGALSVA